MGIRDSPIFRRALPSAGPATARGHAPCNRPHRGPWKPPLGQTGFRGPVTPTLRTSRSWSCRPQTTRAVIKLQAMYSWGHRSAGGSLSSPKQASKCGRIGEGCSIVQEHHRANSARAVLQIGPHEERIADSQRSLGRSHRIRLWPRDSALMGLAACCRTKSQRNPRISGSGTHQALLGPSLQRKSIRQNGHRIVQLSCWSISTARGDSLLLSGRSKPGGRYLRCRELSNVKA
jgi:hypothetical protein